MFELLLKSIEEKVPLRAEALQACKGFFTSRKVMQQQAASTRQAVMQEQPQYLKGRYIVVLNPDQVLPGTDVLDSFGALQVKALQAAQDILKANGIPAQALYSAYGHALTGFAAELSPLQVTKLLADPRVATIESDQLVWLCSLLLRKQRLLLLQPLPRPLR